MGKQLQIKNVDFSENGFRDPLHFTYPGLVLQALEECFVGYDNIATIDLAQYSFDGIHWYDYAPTTEILLAEGEEVAFRLQRQGEMTMERIYDGDETVLFTSGLCRCYGRLDLFVPMGPWAYSDLFASANILNSPQLPEGRLAEGCYSGLFWNCSQMEAAPVLKAEELAPHCYEYMFSYTGITELEMWAHGSVYRYVDEYGDEGSAVAGILMGFREPGILRIPRDLDFPDYELPTNWTIEYLY